ncbi:MAG: hypothetical protein JJV88_02305, partial [Sulfurovum sp.]|nr:hypothetical protein [Sulfurovaceae bacterium]
KSHKNFIEFICIKENITVLSHSEDENKVVANNDIKGRDKTQQLSIKAKERENIGVLYKVKIPQNSAKYPWIAKQVAEDRLNYSYYSKYIRWLLPANFYGSLRPQISYSEEDVLFHDAGSRAGFFYHYSFDSGYNFTLQYEATIDWKNEKKFLNLSELSNSSRRLSFVSLQKNDIMLIAGKYWSAYYDIAKFTDHFMTFGASASGAFNNSGDGAASGTGRAENLVQVHLNKEDYSSTVQYQSSHTNDGKEYDYGVAGSFIYTSWADIKLGAAVAVGNFSEITPEMQFNGIDGNDISIIGGVTYSRDKFMANALLSYSKNHMNDNEGHYFDALGMEIYLRYDINNNIRIAGGTNILLANDNHYIGEFNIKRVILSAQYTFRERTFDDLFFIEISIPKGRSAQGESINKPIIAIGLRYKFNLLSF